MVYRKVLDFWFDELEPRQWWKQDDALDGVIRGRFLDVHDRARRCELFHWRTTAAGRLAEIIVLDQFSRNLFRASPQAFAQDALALALAQTAVDLGCDRELPVERRNFLYLPYMHSESLAIHQVAVELFRKNGSEASFRYEIRHMEIIARFGRYPHRNEILGRESSADEIDFLQTPGSRF